MSEFATCSCGEHYGRVIGYTTDRFGGTAYVTDTCYQATAGPSFADRIRAETTVAGVYVDRDGWFTATGGELVGAWVDSRGEESMTLVEFACHSEATGRDIYCAVYYFLTSDGRIYDAQGFALTREKAVAKVESLIARGY
jgi:hypothetical protein